MFLLILLAFSTSVLATSGTSHNGRIVGGQSAEVGQFPFMVALNNDTLVMGSFCGGAIIDTKWVVTAAHCVVDVAPSDMFVLADSISLNTGGTRYFVSSIVIHPEYNDTVFDTFNDVALVEIQAEFVFSDTAQMIEIGSAVADDDCTIMGWGNTGWTYASDYLKFVGLRILSDADCNTLSGSAKGPGQLCAFNTAGIGACLRDDGGPLVCNGTLVGLESYVIVDCAAGYPDIHTRLSYYLDWINQTIGRA